MHYLPEVYLCSLRVILAIPFCIQSWSSTCEILRFNMEADTEFYTLRIYSYSKISFRNFIITIEMLSTKKASAHHVHHVITARSLGDHLEYGNQSINSPAVTCRLFLKDNPSANRKIPHSFRKISTSIHSRTKKCPHFAEPPCYHGILQNADGFYFEDEQRHTSSRSMHSFLSLKLFRSLRRFPRLIPR